MTSTSWRGNVQYEALHWWCGSPHFWSGSPSRLAGQAISEGNLPFLWYWWHHSTVETHKRNRGLVEHLPSLLKIRHFKSTVTCEDVPVFGSVLGCLASNLRCLLWSLFGRHQRLCLVHLQPWGKHTTNNGIISSVYSSTRLIQQWFWSDLVLNVTFYTVCQLQYDRCERWSISTGSGHNLDRLRLHTRYYVARLTMRQFLLM